MTSYCQLKIGIENSEPIQFYYAYTKRSKIRDLIEFIAYNFPEKNICPCFKIKASYEQKDEMEMEDNWTFESCVNKYTNYSLYKPHCKCSQNIKDIFLKPKIEIIQQLTNTFDKDIAQSNLKVDERTGQIIAGNYTNLNDQTKFNDFYDIIVDIKSIKDICQGWEIKMSEKAMKDYDNKLKTEKVIKIGIIGNSNKGKSFILSKISKIILPVGTNIRTEGLSIKYPDNLEEFKDRRIVLLDSAGFETPVLNEDDVPKIENDVFKEKSREKLITELFLQNYIINNSDILLIAVGILTYSEQKLLNKIKLYLKNTKANKSIFIIHNLITFTKKEQVEEYIKNILFKSITFKLEEGHKISTSTTDENGLYYVEINEDKNAAFSIYHYIMANEGSEAGNYYNDFTIKQLNKFFIVAKDRPFDVIQTIKSNFIEMSNEMFEKLDEPIKLDSFEKNDNKLIKLNKPSNLNLKKCFIDELGFSNLRANGFTPVYNYYRKENKLYLRIEAPGNSGLKSTIESMGEYNYIRLKGNKKQDKEPKEPDKNIYCNREFGDFSLEIGLKASEFNLKNEPPKITDKKGLMILEYTIDENKNTLEYATKEEDEI